MPNKIKVRKVSGDDLPSTWCEYYRSESGELYAKITFRGKVEWFTASGDGEPECRVIGLFPFEIEEEGE